MRKRKTKQNWLNLIIKGYLMVTLVLGLYSVLHIGRTTSALILIYEISYLILSFVIVATLLVRLNFLLIKVKRSGSDLPPLKLQLHSLNCWFIIIWVASMGIYGFQSGGTLFGNFPLITPLFLNEKLFHQLITTQFALTNYLLICALVIFIYIIILYQKNKLEIKIIPTNFGEFNSEHLVKSHFYRADWEPYLFAFMQYLEAICLSSQPPFILLDLELKHLKTLALRQFKKETTPPTLPIIN